MKAIQFGAGNIGRGFIGQLLFESGYEVVFIDVAENIINELNTRKSYLLQIVGNNPRDILIKNVSAINIKDIDNVTRAFCETGLISTAVGVNILPKIAPVLAAGIKKRADLNITTPVNIIICENLLHAGRILKEYIRKNIDEKYYRYIDSNVGFVETVIGRMMPVLPEKVRQKDVLAIRGEEFGLLPVNKKGFIGEIPVIKNMIPSDNFLAYEEQKLYIHNLGHSTAAYLGYLQKVDYIWQAIEIPEIRGIVKKCMIETANVIIKKHNLLEKDVMNYVDDLLFRFTNKDLGDTVYRVAREPLRKLGLNDRFIGSARLVLENGGTPENICHAINAVLKYDYPKDPEAVKLNELIKSKGVDGILVEICQVGPDSKLGKMILKRKIKT